jgi:hypothetical protein
LVSRRPEALTITLSGATSPQTVQAAVVVAIEH